MVSYVFVLISESFQDEKKIIYEFLYTDFSVTLLLKFDAKFSIIAGLIFISILDKKLTHEFLSADTKFDTKFLVIAVLIFIWKNISSIPLYWLFLLEFDANFLVIAVLIFILYQYKRNNSSIPLCWLFCHFIVRIWRIF